MNTRRLLCCILFLAYGCAFSEQQDTVKGDFQPPLVYQKWTTKQYMLKMGANVCTVSSGYNGIAVDLVQRTWGVDTEVESTRMMKPGSTLTVSAGGKNFVTYTTFFPSKTAPEIVEYLSKGGKAYLEWYEPGGPASSGRMHIDNVVKLDDFAAKLKECRGALKS